MAIKGKARKSFKLATGLMQFKVVGFCLRQDQLEELGVKLKAEPNFIREREVTQVVTDNGEVIFDGEFPQTEKITVKVREMQIWLQCVTPKVKEVVDGKEELVDNPMFGALKRISINIEDRNFISAKKGKIQFLNGVGQSMWDFTVQGLPDWFKAKGGGVTPYKSLRGSANLYDFLLAWTNIDTEAVDSSVMLGESPEDLAQIFEPDGAAGYDSITEELNEYTGEEYFQDNVVSLLVGVDGSKTKIFNKVFLGEAPSAKGLNKLLKEAQGEWGFDANYQDTVECKIFDPLAVIAALTSIEVPKDTPQDTAPATPQVVVANEEDDLPF